MHHNHAINRPYKEADTVTGVICLLPSESKRLLAKAVVAMPPVQRALKKGRVIVAAGSTTALVAEEILGRQIPAERYLAGYIEDGALKVSKPEGRLHPYVFVNGKVEDVSPGTILPEFEAGDVLIKSANAVDVNGHAGVLMTGETSGTMGKALPHLQAKGSHLIMPVGLEKLVPSVIEASKVMGQLTIKYTLDMRPALWPVVDAEVVTEIQALSILTGVKATHVASGGIGGSEGAVTLVVEGTDEAVQKTMELVKDIKGERQLHGPKD